MHAIYSANIPRSVGCCSPRRVRMPGLRIRVIAGRHKVDQTLIDNTVTVKERHVPLQF
jgi:hypothetical protein